MDIKRIKAAIKITSPEEFSKFKSYLKDLGFLSGGSLVSAGPPHTYARYTYPAYVGINNGGYSGIIGIHEVSVYYKSIIYDVSEFLEKYCDYCGENEKYCTCNLKEIVNIETQDKQYLDNLKPVSKRVLKKLKAIKERKIKRFEKTVSTESFVPLVNSFVSTC